MKYMVSRKEKTTIENTKVKRKANNTFDEKLLMRKSSNCKRRDKKEQRTAKITRKEGRKWQ